MAFNLTILAFFLSVEPVLVDGMQPGMAGKSKPDTPT
jgi:hypothetical protein